VRDTRGWKLSIV